MWKGPKDKSQLPSKAHETLYSICGSSPPLLSIPHHACPAEPFSSKPPGLGTVVLSFLHGEPSLPFPCLGYSHLYFQTQLKWHLLLKALFDCPGRVEALPAPLHTLRFWHSLGRNSVSLALSVSQTGPCEAGIQLQTEKLPSWKAGLHLFWILSA